METSRRLLACALLSPPLVWALARRLATIDLFVDDGAHRLSFLALRRPDRELAWEARKLLGNGP